MTLEQIKDEIRSLRSSERIELYRWLDYMVVADCNVDTSFYSRLGVDRSLETRRAIVSETEAAFAAYAGGAGEIRLPGTFLLLRAQFPGQP